MINHDYKAIADRLVKKQLLRQLDPQRWPGLYHVEGCADDPLTAGVACHDWRVAGRCLEIEPEKVLWIMRRALSLVEARKIELTLAIILAYLESESENKRGDSENGPSN